MIRTYYLDESGSSGDLASSSDRLDFGGQPIFTLACVGVDDLDGLSDELTRLRFKHNVRGIELKSKALRSKPGLVLDLADVLLSRRSPVMIEVVDKRFFICTMMINHLVLPALGPEDLEPKAQWIRNVMAEYLCEKVPDEVALAYVSACNDRTLDTTMKAYKSLLSWLDARGESDQVATALQLFANDSYKDALALREVDDAWRSGLPIPDSSKSGKPFWMLPNLSSFTNIYARLNILHRRKMSDVTLFHDEQLQFDHILLDAKAATERRAAEHSVPQLRFADYHFVEAAKLEFLPSHVTAGIQVADVLAGFTMRFVQDVLSGVAVSETHREAFDALLALSEPQVGIGFNFVTTTRDLHLLGVHVG